MVRLIQAAIEVEKCWEAGDLAGAVCDLVKERKLAELDMAQLKDILRELGNGIPNLHNSVTRDTYFDLIQLARGLINKYDVSVIDRTV